MKWIWQLSDWRNFPYKSERLEEYEQQFIDLAGQALGTLKHIQKDGQTQLRVELLRNEALLTSEIEGEYLDKDSLQSSIQKQFGLSVSKENKFLKEQGVSDMLMEVYRDYNATLSHSFIQSLHKCLFRGQRKDAGQYREHEAPMQVVSGSIANPTVHYEAPPSSQVKAELEALISWHNEAHLNRSVPPLAVAAITHLWFETIHPFEDGNGRVGRALAEKSLSQSLKRPALISLSSAIQKKKSAYYDAFATVQFGKEIEITPWMEYFQPLVIEAQNLSLTTIEFLIKKSRFLQTYQPQVNERQNKVLLRVLEEGADGVEGGLSARNYTSITQAPATTVTRDLNDLVKKGALTKTGEKKSTRYWLNL